MNKFQRDDILLVFTYAPAGLGHLRVMNALIDGLPTNIDYAVLGANDTRIVFWHRFMSISPLIREAIEWLQGGAFRFWFYAFYIWLLRINTSALYSQLKDLIQTQRNEKKVVVIVSTHFGLAHQIIAIKEKLQKDLKIRLILIDQITDATSMEILYIPGADLIFVPSNKVKLELSEYARKRGLSESNITVSPYPLSLSLNLPLSDEEFDLRLQQYLPNPTTKLKIAIPISGAAVGLNYYDKLSSILGKTLDCEIYVVVKDYVYTWSFIRKMKRKTRVKLIEDQTDKKVVANYDKLYQDEVIGLEIVKPSEQSFKTLFTSKQRGGPILLLTEPIGKQERDNIDFLLDHHLIPNQKAQLQLEKYALGIQAGVETEQSDFLKIARHWKALRLTNDPEKDSRIIAWCLNSGIFTIMASNIDKTNEVDSELAANGVELFWKKVADII